MREILLTKVSIDHYLKMKQEQGVSLAAIQKYRTHLFHLYDYFNQDKQLTKDKLQK